MVDENQNGRRRGCDEGKHTKGMQGEFVERYQAEEELHGSAKADSSLNSGSTVERCKCGGELVESAVRT